MQKECDNLDCEMQLYDDNEGYQNENVHWDQLKIAQNIIDMFTENYNNVAFSTYGLEMV